jgi:hypothetical protein
LQLHHAGNGGDGGSDEHPVRHDGSALRPGPGRGVLESGAHGPSILAWAHGDPLAAAAAMHVAAAESDGLRLAA